MFSPFFSYSFFLLTVVLCFISTSLPCWHLNCIFCWSRTCFISIHSHVPYCVCRIDIDWCWFSCPLRYDLDSLHCLPPLFVSLPLPPQHFIYLCLRLSFRFLWQGLLWSLSLPKWRRLWPHHWPVCLSNRLHWDELWAELSRPSTY